MDAVTDLSARAAAFIGIIQQYCIVDTSDLTKREQFSILRTEGKIIPDLKFDNTNRQFVKRVFDLIWINNEEAVEADVIGCFVGRANKLLHWVWKPDITYDLVQQGIKGESLPTPDEWRQAISKVLYKKNEQRIVVAREISYLPIQLVLAAGGDKDDVLPQRILQEWEAPVTELAFLVNKHDLGYSWNSRAEVGDGQKNKPIAIDNEVLLSAFRDERTLMAQLIKKKVPLSFEQISVAELDEIHLCRNKRHHEDQLGKDSKLPPDTSDAGIEFLPKDFTAIADPVQRAQEMELHALAFSGGGIRSATFNLGILQGFAKAGLISRFDYLSTVSGGGYIGSWFVSWIQREGSVLKVNNRLNPDKSTDPMADQVRPIRWLRMFSNYLSPNSSIMSLDSWTVGMTLLRNMLLNQFVIVSLLITVLLTGKLLRLAWTQEIAAISQTTLFYLSSLFILAGALVAGFGMKFYTKKIDKDKIMISPRKKKGVVKSLIILSCGVAFVVSSFFTNAIPYILHPNDSNSRVGFLETVLFFWPTGVIALAGLMLVAILGRYDRCVSGNKFIGWIAILVFSALATTIGMFSLALVWKIISGMYDSKYAYTFGFPLVLEVLSLTVVVRMALLGNFFPDERREWWGRMGGAIHQISFTWILVFGAALFGGSLFHEHVVERLIPAAGGWAALVLAAVKAAFSPKSSDNAKPGTFSSGLNFLSLAGPYLFMLGLLVFLPVLVNTLLDHIYPQQPDDTLTITVCTAVMAFFTFLIAQRIGVNEFSMHHFYKNRLVRAYLGATRNKAERDNTSSRFTGFDIQDDVLLSSLTSKNYYGPYPIVNTALNASQVSALDRQDRMAESFIFSPLYCGFDFSRTRSSANVSSKNYDYAYRETGFYAYPPKQRDIKQSNSQKPVLAGPHLGSAMSISGAAANPNMGYHSSAATAFLLTAFNVRLGWWIGNPRKNSWMKSDPLIGLPYLFADMAGKSNTDDQFVCLSDGGHFDNMGLYELIRRRTKIIVLGDGEQDEKFICEGLANAIRRCRIDFGVEIEIKVDKITDRKDGFSSKSYAVGTIKYPGNPGFEGQLIYLKSSIVKKQEVDVREYALKNTTFPHQSTGDQFFDEQQFESYRKLGFDIAVAALNEPNIKTIFKI